LRVEDKVLTTKGTKSAYAEHEAKLDSFGTSYNAKLKRLGLDPLLSKLPNLKELVVVRYHLTDKSAYLIPHFIYNGQSLRIDYVENDNFLELEKLKTSKDHSKQARCITII
jgi:hypothetical protein